jgi:hypothetical protein
MTVGRNGVSVGQGNLLAALIANAHQERRTSR